ncbi:MAG: 2Fe-2S iron-sulfur cluster-binding protein [Weeksellaceae bacterium]|nr:2Fe-2S iron-sulfur cluster-binding protein [Weeksellaceae bacterium]
MENQLTVANQPQFHRLKIAKKQQLTKQAFALQLAVPPELKSQYEYKAGQYLTLKYHFQEREVQNDYSITSSPFEDQLSLAIKINGEKSSTHFLFNHYKIGDEISVSEPQGRFFLPSRPNEKRTIIAFASGIGITPILSHIKNILNEEKSTRIFLFYGNKNYEDIILKNELENLQKQVAERFEVFYFLSQEPVRDKLFQGRIDEKKIALIINQILHLDEDDEESTIWDSTDKVLICGPGAMIKSVANACYNHGIPKKNIHFELFETYNEDIYPTEKEFPLIENVKVTIKYNHIEKDGIILKNNERKILQQLLDLGYKLPYSCKSGVCGSCLCYLKNGKVDMTEDEYLTDHEKDQGKILPCTAIAMSKEIFLDFDMI